jgi:hypothetical protein
MGYECPVVPNYYFGALIKVCIFAEGKSYTTSSC